MSKIKHININFEKYKSEVYIFRKGKFIFFKTKDIKVFIKHYNKRNSNNYKIHCFDVLFINKKDIKYLNPLDLITKKAKQKTKTK